MSDETTRALLDLNRTMGQVVEGVKDVKTEVKEFKGAYEKGKGKALEKAGEDKEHFIKLHAAMEKKVDRKEVAVWVFLQRHWLKFGLLGSAGTGATAYRKAIAAILGIEVSE